MERVITGLLVLVGIIHLLPVSGVLGAESLAALYGVSLGEPNLEILMRHRAILFASIALFLISGLSLFRLHFDMDLLAQLPSQQAFKDYRVYLRGFGAFDNLIVVVSGPRPEIVPFADALAAELAKVP